MTPPTPRDLRIDFIRGLGILMLTIDHYGWLVELLGLGGTVKVYTYQSLGWSSAAEFFVFFSGYVLSLTYSRTLAARGFGLTQLRAVQRTWELYVRNALIWLLVLLIAHFTFGQDARLFSATQLDRMDALGADSAVAFMTLRYAPTYFEILQLYMVIILLAPLFLWLQRRSAALALGLSVALWGVVQINPAFNLYSTAGEWNFNPFAWQLVFCLGMWAAQYSPLSSVSRERLGAKVTVVSLLLLGCLALKLIDKAGVALPWVGTIDVAGITKRSMGPLRLAHFLLFLYLLALLVPSPQALLRFRVTRGVALIGTHSLDCFCVTILLAYLSAALFDASPRNGVSYLAIGALNVVLVFAAALWFQWFKSPPWRVPSVAGKVMS